MRTFGVVLFALGVVGYFYCSSQLAVLEPLPPGMDIGPALRLYPAARYQLGQYAAAMAGVIGIIFMMFPRGR